MNFQQNKKLNEILVNAGDFGFRRRVVEVINGLGIESRDKVLDCGCGDGFYVMAIRNLYPRVKVVGVDHDEKMLVIAKKWQPEDEFATFIKADICDLHFDNNFFNKVILSEVLEHLEDDFSGLEEVFRILVPKGVLAITVPNHNYPFFWDSANWIRERLGLGHFDKDKELLAGIWSMHLRLYYPNEIINLVKKAGFKILKTKTLTHYCFPFSQILLHLGKRFYTKLYCPNSIVNTMEKFNWKKAENNRKFNFIRSLQHILQRIDQLNNKREISLPESSQSILIICQK